MNLGFHTGEEDFNASMSVLSIYHQDLMDNFKFYASLQDQKFQKEENTMISLACFTNFMKIMGIAATRDDLSQAVECMQEIDGVSIPFKDQLNILNGLNYAQFLEGILRITYYLKENSDQAGNHDGFKNTLESIFSDAQIDIRDRAKKDHTIRDMLELGQQGFWARYYYLLGAVFEKESMEKNGDQRELSKT